MAIDLKVPEMGESVSEVYIGKWQKKEGDRVERDDQLVELESDKATLDLRAPTAGVLSKILKKSGEAAEIGEVIGQLDDGVAQKQTENSEESAKVTEPKSKKDVEVAADGEARVATKSAPKETSAADTDLKSEPANQTTQKEETRPAPKRDEQATMELEEKPDEPDRQSAEPSRGEERVPMSPIRRRIAARLVEAQQNAALLTTFNEIDMTAVKELRAQHGEGFESRHRVRLGFMSFFVKATVEALREFAGLNAIIDGEEIVYRRYYDIGVAISSDKGLVVPILRDADRMSFAQIEQAIDDFAKRARSAELKVDELQGGTFTITNGGVFGSLFSTPIVNPPQSGVLGMHAIQNRPVAIDNQVVIRPMMYVALTYDHRIVDGREAVTFLRRIKEMVEEPARLLIEV